MIETPYAIGWRLFGHELNYVINNFQLLDVGFVITILIPMRIDYSGGNRLSNLG